MKRSTSVCLLILLLGACAGRAFSEAPAQETPEAVASAEQDALAYARQFADAITNDDKDRARARERVATAFIESGDLQRALACMRAIENWRRGVVLADIAAWLVEQDRPGDALPVLEQAEAFNRGVGDWQHDRIQMHITQARALLAQTNQVAAVRGAYAENRDYNGRAAAALALGLARAGAADEALRLLDELKDSDFFDTQVWRVEGYRLLAGKGDLSADAAAEALEKGWEASAYVPGWKKWELQAALVEAAGPDARANATNLLAGTTAEVEAAGLPGHIKAPFLGRLAAQWVRLGQPERIQPLYELALSHLPNDLQEIEKPEVYALFGEAFALAGMKAEADAAYQKAIAAASGLENPRPRALSCVDIALSLHRSGYWTEEIEEGQRALLATFHDASN